MLSGLVRNGNPTVGSSDGCLTVKDLVGADPTGETLGAVDGLTGCLVGAPPW